MMGRIDNDQERLFYYSVDLDARVRANHPLRGIHETIDFDFICDEVANKYGSKGNVSIPPPVILKLMLLLVFYNVRSERKLMSTFPNVSTGSGFSVTISTIQNIQKLVKYSSNCGGKASINRMGKPELRTGTMHTVFAFI